MYSTGISTRKEVISAKEINAEYITIEDFLENADFIVQSFNGLNGKIVVICQYQDLYLLKGKEDFLISASFKLNPELLNNDNISLEKEELINQIKKQIEDKINIFKKQNNKQIKIL